MHDARRFNEGAFAPLEEFYKERTLRTHVMHEYAKLGAEEPAKALDLVTAYFTVPHKQFIKEFFRGRKDLLERKTTDESYQRIVDELQHSEATDAREPVHMIGFGGRESADPAAAGGGEKAKRPEAVEASGL